MANNDSFELDAGSSPELIEDVTRSKRRRTPMIVLGLVLIVFVLGFVVVLGIFINSEKMGEQASDNVTSKTARLTGSRPEANGNAHEYENNTNNACNPTELQQELAKAKNTIKKLQDKIASIPCQLSCDEVTLKEIEISTGNGPPIRRNVSMDGNWTVIQRRQDGCLSFTKTWEKYRSGFGSPCGNYWLGLEIIHQLTKNGDHELRIDMIENRTGTHYWAEYSSFRLEDESRQYTLRVSGYSGNATDPLTQATIHNWGIANNQKFSTYNVDNDVAGSVHCAAKHLSGWWYQGCSTTNLNGQYGARYHDGILWMDDDNERLMNMRFSEMKMRKRTTQETSVPSLSCLPVSCDGVTLKEIEIPIEEGPSTKRNVSMDGNWTIIQRRIDGCVSFAKTWVEYRVGFGSPCGNFWLGLEAIHQLTKNRDHELRIDMIEKGTGKSYWAEYSSFRLEDESHQYTLRVSGYSGNSTDPLTQATKHHWGIANNQMFSTYDVDNDRVGSFHCANHAPSGWWHQACSITNLNGKYGALSHNGITWMDDDNDKLMNMDFSEMKIRIRN